MSEKKYEYFIPESEGGRAAFETEWAPVEARLKKLLPLKDVSGNPVTENNLVVDVDFSGVADALNGAKDETGLVKRFTAEVEKKGGWEMTVGELLKRPSGELTRWRKMGNRLTLLPNALVLHFNSSE